MSFGFSLLCFGSQGQQSRFRPDVPFTLPGAARPAPRPSPLAPHTLVAPLSGGAGLVGPSSSIDDTLSCLFGEAGFASDPQHVALAPLHRLQKLNPVLSVPAGAAADAADAADAGVRATAALPLQTPATTTL